MTKVTSGPGSVRTFKRRAKYNNRHTHADGLHFDSKKEEARYHQLKAMVESGDINSMEVHPRFYFFLNGKPLVIRSTGYPGGRRVYYEADFAYRQGEGLVVEDVKGMDSDVSRLKRALVELFHGVEVKVVK